MDYMRYWSVMATYLPLSLVISKFISNTDTYYDSMLRVEQIIFSSSFNITKILVPADGSSYVHGDFSDIPSIFFTINDPRLDGGYCIYVLEDLAAYEILEGGRDSTSDYSGDKSVYFGAKDGIYKYDAESLSAKKYGPFRDDIVQIQKANGTDAIFFLDSNKKIFKLEKNGTVKTRVQSVTCALEFVLDTSNNLYFIACDDGLPRIVKPNGHLVTYASSVTEDGFLHLLYANGTSEKKDFYMKERPTAFSIDASLYLVAALNGKIYEFNVMEAMLKSMFGYKSQWPTDLTKIVMSMLDIAKDGVYREWNMMDR